MPLGEPLRGRMRHGLIYLGLPVVHPLWDDPDLVSFLGFEEGSGNEASDDYTWTMADASRVLWVTGKVGKGIQCLGYPKGYLSCPYDSAFDLQVFSIAVWIKTTDTEWQIIYAKGYGSSGPNYGFVLDLRGPPNSGKLEAFCFASDGSNINVKGTQALNDDNWHHIVVNYNGSAMEVFVDNISIGTASWSKIINYGSYPQRIGADARNGLQVWLGLIDEFYIFKRVLTASERTLLYEV